MGPRPQVPCAEYRASQPRWCTRPSAYHRYYHSLSTPGGRVGSRPPAATLQPRRRTRARRTRHTHRSWRRQAAATAMHSLAAAGHSLAAGRSFAAGHSSGSPGSA
eukprot:scaffold20868_cov48-Phaeocystis_antarctica.AAC.2